MIVNLFLSNYVWTQPLNAFGVRQHVAALYEEVFRGHDARVYPRNPSGPRLSYGLRYMPALLSGDVNVLAPDEPVIAGALVSWVRRKPGFIVHTWKVPGISDERLTARVHDWFIRRVINRARAVVVVSMVQKRQLEAMRVRCPVLFAPVSVDSSFWHPQPDDMDAVLGKFALPTRGYVLTAGGPGRDEIYAARLAKHLGTLYVRVSYDRTTAERARSQLVLEKLDGHSRMLVNPTDVELRALYAGSLLVCLPTLTRTNPSGLTSAVVAMSCGAAVAIPESIAEGYIEDGVTGFVLNGTSEVTASRLRSAASDLPSICGRAREFAETRLNNLTIAQTLREQLQLV